MDYTSALKWRYATKKFDRDKKIDQLVLDRILEAGNLTATSLGLQAFKILKIDNQAVREAMLPYCYNQRQVVDASDVLVLCADTHFDDSKVNRYMERISATRNQDIEKLDGFKNMISGYLNSIDSSEKMDSWLSKQTYIALGTLLTACALEKVDSCPMEGFQPNKISEVLGLEEKGLVPTLILPVGYRSEEDGNQHLTKVRKAMDEFVETI